LVGGGAGRSKLGGRPEVPGSWPINNGRGLTHLGLLDARGHVEPLLVGGRSVPASRVLPEAVPQMLSALEPHPLRRSRGAAELPGV
jgi:hypothetical protein